MSRVHAQVKQALYTKFSEHELDKLFIDYEPTVIITYSKQGHSGAGSYALLVGYPDVGSISLKRVPEKQWREHIEKTLGGTVRLDIRSIDFINGHTGDNEDGDW